MGKIEDTKDKAVGRMLEAAGKITNDQELEFTGKFKTMTTQIKDRFYYVQEDVVQEAQNLVDPVNDKWNNKE